MRLVLDTPNIVRTAFFMECGTIGKGTDVLPYGFWSIIITLKLYPGSFIFKLSQLIYKFYKISHNDTSL